MTTYRITIRHGLERRTDLTTTTLEVDKETAEEAAAHAEAEAFRLHPGVRVVCLCAGPAADVGGRCPCVLEDA